MNAKDDRDAAPGRYVCVATVHGPIEEAQICSFLQSNGIPAQTRGEAIRRIHGITLDGIGAAEVLVPAQYALAAQELIARVERGELQIEEDSEEQEKGDPAASS